jgi:hypothetical protein
MTTHITPDAGGGRRWLLRGFAFVCGLGALVRFLVRVIPNPDLGPASSIQLLDKPGVPMAGR